MDVKRFNDAATEASDFLKSLANPVRLRIVCALAGQERSVTMLSEVVGAPQSTISRHLMLMRKDRIVSFRRSGQTIFYALADSNVEKIIVVMFDNFCATGPASVDGAPQGHAGH
jgi:DNA-binding transcriptional ArsR family regulator